MSLNLSKIDLKGFEGGCNEAADKPFVTVEVSSSMRRHEPCLPCTPRLPYLFGFIEVEAYFGRVH